MPAPSPQQPLLTADGPYDRPSATDAQIWGWLFFLSSMFWPRVVIFAFWIFGSQLGRAFDSWVIPVVGFLLVPWTTMTYAFLWGANADRVSGWEWVVVGLALVLDLVTWARGRSLVKS